MNLQAFRDEKDFTIIKNYEDFIKSKCEFIFFIDDNSYIDIYAKDIEIIEIVKSNAELNKFKNIEYITKENDMRQGPEGFFEYSFCNGVPQYMEFILPENREV